MIICVSKSFMPQCRCNEQNDGYKIFMYVDSLKSRNHSFRRHMYTYIYRTLSMSLSLTHTHTPTPPATIITTTAIIIKKFCCICSKSNGFFSQLRALNRDVWNVSRFFQKLLFFLPHMLENGQLGTRPRNTHHLNSHVFLEQMPYEPTTDRKIKISVLRVADLENRQQEVEASVSK